MHLLEWLKGKRLTTLSVGKDVAKQNSHNASGNANWYNLEKFTVFFLRSKHILAI